MTHVQLSEKSHTVHTWPLKPKKYPPQLPRSVRKQPSLGFLILNHKKRFTKRHKDLKKLEKECVKIQTPRLTEVAQQLGGGFGPSCPLAARGEGLPRGQEFSASSWPHPPPCPIPNPALIFGRYKWLVANDVSDFHMVVFPDLGWLPNLIWTLPDES